MSLGCGWRCFRTPNYPEYVYEYIYISTFASFIPWGWLPVKQLRSCSYNPIACLWHLFKLLMIATCGEVRGQMIRAWLRSRKERPIGFDLTSIRLRWATRSWLTSVSGVCHHHGSSERWSWTRLLNVAILDSFNVQKATYFETFR
jgi:hypothetical protein